MRSLLSHCLVTFLHYGLWIIIICLLLSWSAVVAQFSFGSIAWFSATPVFSYMHGSLQHPYFLTLSTQYIFLRIRFQLRLFLLLTSTRFAPLPCDSHVKLFEGLHKYALSLFADRPFSESVPVWMKGLETAVSLRNHLLMKKLFHHIAHALEKAGFSKKAAIAAEKGRRMSILLDQELEGLIECVPGVSKEQVFCLKNILLRKSARYLRLSFDVWMKRCDGQGQELVCTGDLERFYGRSQPKLSTESFPSLPGY